MTAFSREFDALTAGRDALLPDTALRALTQGDAFAAYAAADRWIRLAGPNADNLLIRAEAAHRLGFAAHARDDVAEALARGPAGSALYRRLAAWGDDRQKAEAARASIGGSSHEASAAARTLAALGASGAGFVRVVDGRAIGRLAWRVGAKAALQLRGEGAESVTLAPDPEHAWAPIFGAAADFELDLGERPPLSVALTVQDVEIAVARVPGTLRRFDPADALADAALTVVIPVYDDFEATRACLETAFAEMRATPGCETLVVDDDAPDPRLKRYLLENVTGPGARLLVDPVNLGYVGAVNRALRHIRGGDVLLLNADTLLPEGALRRFLACARAHPDAGIVNPLSNHGEFVSYPGRFRENAHDPERWRAIDRAAAAAGAGEIVDLPSGTGFCAYVTRACLDAVGELSGDFGDGYLEDADYGLRARAAGFRNVCAPSIYVPHLGSRSFAPARKQALVSRNRHALARRFPDYAAECRAFVAADPLAAARARVESALAGEARRRRLILGPSRFEPAMRARAERVAQEGIGAVLGFVDAEASGLRVRLRAADGSAPQNVDVLCETGEALAAVANAWPHDRIEWIVAPGAQALPCGAGGAPSLACDALVAGPAASLEHFDRVLGADALAAAWCGAAPPDAPRAASRPERGEALAIVLPFETAETLALLMDLARRLRDEGRTAVLFGSTRIDERLIANGLFATGPIAAPEIARVLDVYRIGRYFLPLRDGGFWAVEMFARVGPAPIAFFDWSGTGFRLHAQDLPLDPARPRAAVLEDLFDWAFGGAGGDQGR